jgi:hypothetical protein
MISARCLNFAFVKDFEVDLTENYYGVGIV